jgi:2-oxo-4-hydroxy-4-carboxy--5-ureidoimidazoline (OHCU) decarboxylase
VKKLKRREFLQKGALVMAGAAALASGVSVVAGAEQWTAGLKTLNPHEGETLLKMARQIYPHDQLDDIYYIKVVRELDTAAGAKPETATLLRQGVNRLDRLKHTKFVSLSETEQVTALKQVDRSEFFEKVRGIELVALYNNPGVWKKLGYPGASYPIGGYLHHGFNDLNWLPDPPESASPKPA